MYVDKKIVFLFLFVFFFPINFLFAQGFPVVINEVMVTPVDAGANSLYDNGSQTGYGPMYSAQWIEFYNMSPCDTIDLGCYLMASNMSFGNDTNKGVFRFFGGTTIPPLGYIVVGGDACTIRDFNILTAVDSVFCMTKRWWLNDQAGWIALYDMSSHPKSAVYWNATGNPGDLNTSPQYACDVETNIQRCTCCSPGTMIRASQFPGIQFCGNTIFGSGFSFARKNDGSLEWELSQIPGGTPKACNAGFDSIYHLDIVLSDNLPVCNGESSGSIEANLSIIGYPRAPYTYSWSNGSTSASVYNIPADTYFLTVTDAFGCETIETYVLQNPPALIVQENHVDATCYGASDGSASVIVSGGLPPYSYLWNTNPPQFTSSLDNLLAGQYAVTVTDSLGCSHVAVFFISEPSDILITDNIVNACVDSSNGEIHISVSGGTPPYTYLWSNASIESEIYNLYEGVYSVTVKDANLCEKIKSFIISNTVVSLAEVPDMQVCNGAEISLSTVADGGTAPYQFFWIFGSDTISGTSYNFSPQTNSSISVFAYDANNCSSQIQNINIEVLPSLSLHVIADKDSICPDEIVTFSASAFGGTGESYHYFLEDTLSIVFPYSCSVHETSNVLFSMGDECGSTKVFDSVFVFVKESPSATPHISVQSGCVPLSVLFSALNTDSSNIVHWMFGDGSESSFLVAEHHYSLPGEYSISLDLISPNSCNTHYSIIQPVKVYPLPIANFDFYPQAASMLKPEISFLNYSGTFSIYFWDFGDASVDSLHRNPSHFYSAPGTYPVQLVIENEFSCTDTIVKNVTISDALIFYAPTAFTPGKDYNNNSFNVFVSGIDENSFSLRIFDRWGLQVYITKDINQGWNGRIAGFLAPIDSYVWFAEFTDLNGTFHRKSGVVTLVE